MADPTDRRPQNGITARTIADLLAQKHSKDVFVSECKDGPSQGQSHLRLDGWAMPRSWAHPYTVGYEIKVTRSDFLRDAKWPSYLGLCHSFYFVVAPGVVQPFEVPEEAGLMVVAKTGSRLLTKKKAPLRNIVVPEDLWRYVLMCRTRIVTEQEVDADRTKEWERWMKERDAKKALGWNVSRKIRELVTERITKVENENHDLRTKIEMYASAKKILAAAGISSWDHWMMRQQLERRMVEMAKGCLPPDYVRSMDQIINTSMRLKEQWERLSEKFAENSEDGSTDENEEREY